MEYTEEIKKEADSTLIRILVDIIDYIEPEHQEELSARLAIQDRQSVLKDNNSVLEMLKLHGDLRTRLPIHERIQSLTQQIDYLKSKL